MDLNNIVQDYKVSKAGEFEKLHRNLANVPISLDGFEKYLREGYDPGTIYSFSDLVIMAEFHDPLLWGTLLSEFTENGEPESEIITPYPRIIINSAPLSGSFYMDAAPKLGELILPDHEDPTARVLSNPETCAVCVKYEKRNKTKYLEIVLANGLIF